MSQSFSYNEGARQVSKSSIGKRDLVRSRYGETLWQTVGTIQVKNKPRALRQTFPLCNSRRVPRRIDRMPNNLETVEARYIEVDRATTSDGGFLIRRRSMLSSRRTKRREKKNAKEFAARQFANVRASTV